ncbi:MAG: hypothetical protein GY848_15255 [Methyloversatilis sp.]|jgi:hypothetical protein|nr:hypothetical protein [Methyloversatilis sp.]
MLNHGLMRRLALALLVCAASCCRFAMAEVTVDQVLSERAAVGAQPRVFHASTPEGDLVLGVVLGRESGRLLVLRRNAAGRYEVEAASAPFRNDFGIGYDLEIVEYNGRGRFSMDVAAHSACGVRVETFRFYRVSGQWRVSGYDREDPDVQSCDVNFRARTYSANLLTGQVVVTTWRQGRAVAVNKRKARIDAPRLEDFSFSLFADEP